MTATSTPGVLGFFITCCEGRGRSVRCLFLDEIVKPAPGSRQISLEDFQNVVRDLVDTQEMFDQLLRPGDRDPASMPPGRSFRCLRGATFALHQFTSGTGVRFFLMTDPNYSTPEAQRKLSAIYSGPFIDLVCRNQSISLRDLLNQPPKLSTVAPDMGLINNQPAQNVNSSNTGGHSSSPQHQREEAAVAEDDKNKEKHMYPSLPPAIHAALRMEIHAILKSS